MPPSSKRFTARPGDTLAVSLHALGAEYTIDKVAERSGADVDNGGVIAEVHFTGPLTYADPYFVNYSDIVESVRLAAASSANVIVLRPNSPGGILGGAFDAAREIAGIARAAGKPLVAYIENECHSAAYALACTADQIVCSASAQLGSIGVIRLMTSMHRQLDNFGVDAAVLISGEAKADGNPMLPLHEAALKRGQAHVDESAQRFFELVAEHRSVSPEHVQALQANIFSGASGLRQQLVDAVMPWTEYREFLMAELPEAQTETTQPISKSESSESRGNMSALKIPTSTQMRGSASDDEDETRAALVKASKSSNEKEARRAKRALAAYDAFADDDDEKSEDSDESDEPDDEKSEDSKDDAKAESDDDDQAESDDDKAIAASALAGLAAKVTVLEKAQRAQRAKANAEQRAQIFATRPDVAAGVRESLAQVPTAQLETVLAAIPRGPIDSAAATGTPKATLGADHEEGFRGTPEEIQQLKIQAGLVPMQSVATYENNTLTFGASRPKGQ